MFKRIICLFIACVISTLIISGCSNKKNEKVTASNNLKEEKKIVKKSEIFEKGPAAPASDFKYKLSDDMNGVIITEYVGNSQNITIPSEIEEIPVVELGENAFRFNNKDIVSIFIPDSIKKLGDYVFSGCESLKYVELSKNLSELPNYCFSYCSAFEQFEIPSQIKKIGQGAFSYSGLKSITVPEGVELESAVFSSCFQLEKAVLPKSLTLIPHMTFYECKALKDFVIPETVTILDGDVFYGCVSLQELIIPSSVQEIWGRTFWGMKINSLNIPNSVVKLDSRALSIITLEELHLPDSLTVIDDDLLSSMFNLKKVNIPASIKSVWPEAFRSCEKLEELIIPESLSSVDFIMKDYYEKSFAFQNVKLPLKTQKRLMDMGYTGPFRE